MSIHVTIPDWVTILEVTRNPDDTWTCTVTGDQYRTGRAHTGTSNLHADPQIAINLAANMAGGAQERAVAMGLETADAIDQEATR